MALHIDPHDQQGRDDRRARTGAVGDLRQVVRDGVQVLARGSLVCPGCSVPISPAPRVAVGQPMACPMCDHTDRAAAFVHRDVSDTPANAVVVVARLGPRGLRSRILACFRTRGIGGRSPRRVL